VDRSRLALIFAQRFARFVTNAVLRRPALWRLLRAPFRRQFELLAPSWDGRPGAGHLEYFERALDALREPPRRVLDLGTGTGAAALAIARRFPEAEILGVDLAEAMVAQARRKIPPELAGRVRFETADAAKLRFEDASFDLVALANMIPFFDELARLVAPGGAVAIGFSLGAATPIYVPPERLRRELAARGFSDFEEVGEARGTAVLARKRTSG
jgi:SAM-dependent methyltransferase